MPRSAVLAEALERVRYEIIPISGVREQLDALPHGSTVTVTSSPSRGVDATLEVAEEATSRGFFAVPHLAARTITGPGHLRAVLRRIGDLGSTEVFVVAGDAPEPAGPYEGSLALLQAMAELDHGFADVGITGYPESHAFLPDQTTIQAMFDKVPYATYIVSQICYDPQVTANWLGAVRKRGVRLPVFIGIPGAVDPVRLARISVKVGLGDSMRFLRKQSGVVKRMMTRYTPDELVDGLSGCVADPWYGVAGWHVFTFNEVVRTEAWRRGAVARLKEVRV